MAFHSGRIKFRRNSATEVATCEHSNWLHQLPTVDVDDGNDEAHRSGDGEDLNWVERRTQIAGGATNSTLPDAGSGLSLP